MSLFCSKKLEAPRRISERLKKAREEQGLTLEQVSQKTHIGLNYLSAIENNCFAELPKAKAFRLAYIKTFAEAVGEDGKLLGSQFGREFEDEEKGDRGLRQVKDVHVYSLSNILKNIASAAAVVVFMAYLVWQVRGILEPPKLIVYTPVDGYVTSHLFTLVQGETGEECQLTINGQEVRVSEKGQFEFSIDLSNGLNTIVISATKKHGKTTTITRHVVGRQDVGQSGSQDKVSLLNN